MDLSLRRLEEAVGVRRQIDALEQRLAALVGGGRSTSTSTSTSSRRTTGRRTMSAATRAKIAAAARAGLGLEAGGKLARLQPKLGGQEHDVAEECQQRHARSSAI